MSPEDQELEIRELRQRIAERDVVIARVREHAVKMVEWKGAPNPFGPLHGAGMVASANAEGKVLLRVLDGKADPEKPEAASIPPESQTETRQIMARLWERAASSYPSLASHAPEVGIEAAWVIVREAVACGLVDWSDSDA